MEKKNKVAKLLTKSFIFWDIRDILPTMQSKTLGESSLCELLKTEVWAYTTEWHTYVNTVDANYQCTLLMMVHILVWLIGTVQRRNKVTLL